DVDLQCRIVQVLWNENVIHTLQPANFSRKLLRGFISSVQIVSADLNIDRSRQPEIDNCVYQSAGLEIRRELRQILSQFLAHAIHIFIATDRVSFFETYLHCRCMLAGIAGVHRRKSRLHADVRDNNAQVMGRDNVTDLIFNLLDVAVCNFEPSPSGRFDVDHELSRVRSGKERNTEQWIKCEGEEAYAEDADHTRRRS